MRSLIRLSAFLLLIPASLSADRLSTKYRSWDKSPEAYFLTSEERMQWKGVRADAEAEKFVADYFARRGSDFPAMLKERIAAADKYFSSGKIKGSETLRGKVIILFGPPTSIGQTASKGTLGTGGVGDEAQYAGTGVPHPYSNVGAGAAGLAHSERAEQFNFDYDKRQAPAAIGKPFRVEILLRSGSDQQPLDPQGLEEKFEAVAKASIVREASGR
jgi:GWxTD domain-containing protein